MGIKLGRTTKPKLKVGICGEHGGEPMTVEFCHKVGMDYVSCSPFRVPIARLAAVRIAWAKDKAFGFYYADDLAALRAAGAELVPLDTLHDKRLPEVDGLFIGGGFPELFMSELEANATLREDIRSAIENGMPAYAECGGLMYLARSLTWHGQTNRMAGVIPATF